MYLTPFFGIYKLFLGVFFVPFLPNVFSLFRPAELGSAADGKRCFSSWAFNITAVGDVRL